MADPTYDTFKIPFQSNLSMFSNKESCLIPASLSPLLFAYSLIVFFDYVKFPFPKYDHINIYSLFFDGDKSFKMRVTTISSILHLPFQHLTYLHLLCFSLACLNRSCLNVPISTLKISTHYQRNAAPNLSYP